MKSIILYVLSLRHLNISSDVIPAKAGIQKSTGFSTMFVVTTLPCLIAGLIILCLAASIVSSALAMDQELPKSDDYLVKDQFNGVPVPVDLKSHPSASQFKTRLRDGAKEGPNFSVYYTVITWGCGSSCSSLALINANSGQVIFPDEISPIFFVGIIEDPNIDYDVIYNKNSSLLIIHGVPSTKEKPGTYYYNFKNNIFELIESIEWNSKSNK